MGRDRTGKDLTGQDGMGREAQQLSNKQLQIGVLLIEPDIQRELCWLEPR